MNIKCRWLSLFYLVLLILIPSCNKDDFLFDKDHPILGNWEFVTASEEESYTLYHMKRMADFSDKFGSINFGTGGEFKNMGAWGIAAQPTLFTGTWSAQNDKIILVEMTLPFAEKWKMVVKKLDREHLDYYYLYP
jgi:hypothetical protein